MNNILSVSYDVEEEENVEPSFKCDLEHFKINFITVVFFMEKKDKNLEILVGRMNQLAVSNLIDER